MKQPLHIRRRKYWKHKLTGSTVSGSSLPSEPENYDLISSGFTIDWDDGTSGQCRRLETFQDALDYIEDYKEINT